MPNKDFPKSKKPYPAPFSIRLNQEERNELQKLAAGLPMGRFIKDAVFSKGMRPARSRGPSVADQKLFAQLLGVIGQSRIASNINQLARAANSGSLPVNKEIIEGLNEAVEAVKWMRETLIKAIGLKPQSKEERNDSEG